MVHIYLIELIGGHQSHGGINMVDTYIFSLINNSIFALVEGP